jgi:hypothetical protein
MTTGVEYGSFGDWATPAGRSWSCDGRPQGLASAAEGMPLLKPLTDLGGGDVGTVRAYDVSRGTKASTNSFVVRQHECAANERFKLPTSVQKPYE